MVSMTSAPTTDLSTASPVEIDTFLAKNWGEQDQLRSYIANDRDSIRQAAGQRQGHRGRRWNGTLVEALEFCQANLTRSYVNSKGETVSYPSDAAKALDSLAKHEAHLDALVAAAEPFELEYQRRRWARYFLVKNNNGHVHASMGCNTCFPTTQYGWLVELAGKSEAQMVEEFGEMACTVCFPSAPTNPAFYAPGSRSREALAAKEAEAAAKAEAKYIKALRPEEQFNDHMGHKVTTVAGAKQAIRDEIDLHYYNNADGSDPHSWWLQAVRAKDEAVKVLRARGVSSEEIAKIQAGTHKRVQKAFRDSGK